MIPDRQRQTRPRSHALLRPGAGAVGCGRHSQESGRLGSRLFRFAAVAALALFAPLLRAQSEFLIQSAAPAFIGAGADGATVVLNGNDSLFGIIDGGYQVCFYNGLATSTPITPTFTNGVTSIAVPASSIQSIPASAFTAANGYSVTGQIYVASQGVTTCDGTFDSTLTNSLAEPVSEPLLGTYSGPTNIPQTNSATTLQPPPTAIVISGSNFTTGTTVTLGSFGGVTATLLSPSAISFPVPAALSSSAVGTSATVTVCNGTTYCSGAASTLTLTVTALVPSAGTLTITPTPTTVSGTTTLTAQFKRSTATGTTLPEPGAPSGTVTFTANGNPAGTASLVLDPTAVFVPVASTTTIPATATPVITPPAGPYIGSQTITITDSAPGAAIYYTTDGTTPTTASTAYTGPFSISASGTVSAIALASGFRTSAVASNAYTITILPASKLAFVTQPTNAATGIVITPPVQVAIEDVDGNVVTTGASASAPVTIAIAANPGQGTLAGTLTRNAVNGIATFSDLSITTISNGYSLNANSRDLIEAISNTFNITPYPITVRLFAPLIGVTSTLPGTFTLSQPAPQGGVTVSLSSSDTTLVTVSPATVTVAAGQTTGSFTYTGVQPTSTAPPANNNLGVATITASAPNYLAGTASVTETYSLVSLSTIPAVAPAQVIDLATSLATNAPAGGVTIFFTSSDPTIATITQSVFVPAGQRTAAANPQITGVKIGTTNIVATAQGYAPAYRTVNVTVTASFNPGNIQIPLATTNIPTLNITAPAQPGGLTFTLSSDTPADVTVPASVTIPAGQTSVVVPVTGVADSSGYIAVRANSPGVTEADLGVNVTSHINVGNVDVGVNTQNTTYVSLPSTSPTPVTVTVTSANPAIALLSTSSTAVGSASLTFNNITSSIPTIYVQGQSAGTTTIGASAPGYTTTAGNYLGTVTSHLTGFTFSIYNSNPFNTTTFSSATNYTIVPALLDGNHNFYNFATLSPGISPVSITVTSSSPGVGTVTSPVVFHAGDTQQYTSFQPVSAGTTTLSLGATPAGYTTPNNYNTSVANVTAPQLSINSFSGGVNMQGQTYVYLPVAPPNPVSVTVTSSNPAVALLSAAGTTTGTASITVNNVTGSFNVYVQGKSIGSSTITATATGYASATGSNAGTASITAGGFVINPYNGTTYSTTTFSSPNTGFQIVPAILDGNNNFSNFATLSPGVGTVNVPISSSSTAVGTVSPNPVVFHAGDTGQNFTFTPVGAGTTNFGISGTPTGFTTGANYQTVAGTVTAPQLSIGSVITGVNLQSSVYVNLPVAPPNPVTVTITSGTAGVALLSTSPTAVGTNSLTVTNVTSGFNVYVSGKATGSTTLTATAAGYTSATGSNAGTVTIYPSGFVFYYGVPIDTTTFSSPTSFPIYPGVIYPSSAGSQAGNLYTLGTIAPGVAPITVPVTSSDTIVGTVSSPTVVFNPGDSQQSNTFQPTSAGTTTIAIGTPAGYTTPNSNYESFVATVTAPALQMNNVITGYGLEATANVYLPVSPPNPVTVTVTSNGPAIATISKDGTVVGGPVLTFTNVTSAGNLPNIYVQGQPPAAGSGQSSVATTLTASAAGYTNAVATATVYPSGFATYGDQSFTTSVANGPNNVTVYPWALNPGTLTLYNIFAVSPETPISVSVTSSDTSVGTISKVPLVFNPGDSQQYFIFTPAATGTTVFTIGNPNTAIFSNPSSGQTGTITVQ